MTWRELERKFWYLFFALAAVAILPVIWQFQVFGALYFVLGGFSLGLGFRLLVLLCNAFLGIRPTNPLTLLLALTGKIGVWMGVVSSPLWLPRQAGPPFALGCGVFLISLLVFGLWVARVSQKNTRSGGSPLP